MKQASLLCLGMFLLVLGGCSGKQGRKEAPLKENMSLKYQISFTHMGTTKQRTEVLKFRKLENGNFEFTRYFIDDFGDREVEKTEVSPYFMEKEVMPVNLEGKHLWMDPKMLASGKPDYMNITKTTFNGRDVYSARTGGEETSYYLADSGIIAGSEFKHENTISSAMLLEIDSFQ